jgi:predicted dehydrogenase
MSIGFAAMADQLSVALLGSKFMGRAHSNGWLQASHFFDLPLTPRLTVVSARNPTDLEAFASRWGWSRWTTDWQEAVTAEEVDLVDIGTPNHVHREQAIAALEAGKHVACEKPLAGTLEDAEAMVEVAESADARTFVWFTYRRVPAIAFAHRLIADGFLGRIFHIRAAYLQGWGGPDTPLAWRFQAEAAGTGAHGDLNAHIIDMARFLISEEITEVSGAIEERFIPERELPAGGGRGTSTVDDAVLFLARFTGGAVASFEATRLATGVKNSNRFELHGERGAIRFNFERMNELDVFDATEPASLQGWKTVQTTHREHPYAAAWWPEGHWLGYEHTFANQAADIARSLGGESPEVPLPGFADALQTQRVMEAALISARRRAAVDLEELSP